MATVRITAEARQQLGDLPKAMHHRLWKVVDCLKDWPNVSGVKPLTGDLAGWFRKRTGDYRIRFRVDGETVTVDKIGHRRDFYDD